MISFHYLSRLIQISISSVIINFELNFEYVFWEWFVQSMTVIGRNHDFHSFIFDNLSFILFISDSPNEHIRIIRISEFWCFFFRWYAWIDMEEKVKSWNWIKSSSFSLLLTRAKMIVQQNIIEFYFIPISQSVFMSVLEIL